MVAAQLGLRSRAGYELLSHIGGEFAGAVAVLPEHELPQTAPTEVHPISVEEVSARIDALPTNPLGLDVAGRTRLSLAGVQPKLLLTRDASGRWASPTPGSPSTHILSLPSEAPRPARIASPSWSPTSCSA